VITDLRSYQEQCGVVLRSWDGGSNTLPHHVFLLGTL